MRSSLLLLALALFTSSAVAQQEVTLAPSKDNTLYEDTNGAVSNGAGDHLFAGVTRQGSIRRGLLAFDLTGMVPAGATIENVELTLNMSNVPTGATPQGIALHRVTADWGEGSSDASGAEGRGATATDGDATWIHTFSSDQTWATPGGDFASEASASRGVDAVGNYTWGSTDGLVADVQQWLDTPADNFGWILLGNESANQTARRFDSRESSNPPSLRITYAPAVAAEDGAKPVGLRLIGSHPNPFRTTTTISYAVREPMHVKLEVFDVLGRRVATLLDAVQEPGEHAVPLARQSLPGGLYTVRLSADGIRLHHRITLLR